MSRSWGDDMSDLDRPDDPPKPLVSLTDALQRPLSKPSGRELQKQRDAIFDEMLIALEGAKAAVSEMRDLHALIASEADDSKAISPNDVNGLQIKHAKKQGVGKCIAILERSLGPVSAALAKAKAVTP